MTQITEIIPKRIYKIDVPLPNSPLKNLNSYVVIGDNRNLLVDTGFNRPECLEALQGGLATLGRDPNGSLTAGDHGLDMNKTDIFITHVHADHSGLTSQIAGPDSKIYMNPIDKSLLNSQHQEGNPFWQRTFETLSAEGFPDEELEEYVKKNPALLYVSKKNFEAIPVNHLDKIFLPPFEFTCVHTPGHSPGHTCLYLAEHKLMFLGDHILFDISPNITIWPIKSDSLKSYFNSLREIKNYDIEIALAAHRAIGKDVKNRADQLIDHHINRLQEVYSIIEAEGGLTAYQVASRMKWSIRCRDWTDFPPGQKGFAVGEAIAHIYYLVDEGRISGRRVNGKTLYYTVDK